MAQPSHNTSGRRLRILLCGYGHLGLALLQGLLKCTADCELVGVFRWSARPESRHCWEPVEGTFQQHVEQAGLRDVACQGINAYEFTALLRELQPDVVLVGSWGEIIKKHVLDQPGIQFINCHPSKLPAHRGANPYSSVVRAQEAETGVTFHRMAPQIDAGAILLQRAVPLSAEESGASVRDKCMTAAYEMVPELVGRLKAHVVQGAPLAETVQDHSRQSYYPQLKVEDGQLNWQDPPNAMHRQMRALFPWIVCYGALRLPVGSVRVLFYNPNIVTGLPEAGALPGTILSVQGGTLRIALADATQVLAVSSYQLMLGGVALPVGLSRLLAPMLRGKQFISQEHQ